MLAFVSSPLALLLLGLGLRGALGTRGKSSLPYAAQASFLAQQQQFLAQQQLQQPQAASLEQVLLAAQQPLSQSLLSQPLQQSLLSQPQPDLQQALLSQQAAQLPSLGQQAALGGLLDSSSQFAPLPSQQDLLQAQQSAQLAALQQPPAPSGMEALASDPALQATSFSQMPQMQNIMANVPMQEVVNLMHSVETLQKKTQGLEKQLSEERAHEKQLNDVAYNAAYRSNTIDQSARKLASLAQASVNQAQKSVDQEKTMVESMKTHLKEVEKEKSDLSKEKDELRAQLSQTRSKLKHVQDREAAESFQSDANEELSAELSKRHPAWKQELGTQASPGGLAQQALKLQALTSRMSPESLALLSDSMRLRSAPSSAMDEPAMQETLIERLRSQPGMGDSAMASEALGTQPSMSFLNSRR